MSASLNRAALRRLSKALSDDDDAPIRLLARGGLSFLEVDLTDANLVGGIPVKAAAGYAVRMMRHGSNPGARLELSFGGSKADKFFAPGKIIRGGFDAMEVKLAAGGARVGKATLALINTEDADVAEDLIIGAIGPVDLLGSTGNDGNLVAANAITVAEDTDPSGANPVGSFDASGWSKLRIFVFGTSAAGNATTFDLVPWSSPTYSGTVWCEQGTERISVPDSDTTGAVWRVITCGWTGRGLGYFAVRNLQAVARTGLGLIVQGLE